MFQTHSSNKVNPSSWVVLHRWPWVVAPPWPDHLFPMAEGLCCPVCGRTKLRGALRMDERRANERLAGRLRFFLFSLPFLLSFCCLLSDRWCAREMLFVLFSLLILSCPPQSCYLNFDDGTERWSQSRRLLKCLLYSCRSTLYRNNLQFQDELVIDYIILLRVLLYVFIVLNVLD